MTPKNTIKPKIASRSDVLLCHTPQHYDSIEKTVGQLKEDQLLITHSDLTLSPKSLEIALRAVGGVMAGVDAVMQTTPTAFCLIRPPGHHATASESMGFCIFNNVAIGTRYVQKKYGIKKVLIVDWDVHHGNGTQSIFENDPSVFFFSTHQSGLYPQTGDIKNTGCYPIESTSDASLEIINAIQYKLIPLMEDFKPEFIFISCGFDALKTDPLGQFNLTPSSFGTLTQLVKEIAKKHSSGRIVSCLEGGYDLNGIGQAAVEHVKELQNP